MINHSWMLLPSGRRLDLLNPHPSAWTDADLASRLSRTFRWCSDTSWERSLSVAQHSLAVLHLRLASTPAPLSAAERLRELLHDAEEGLTHYDVPTPLKPLLGPAYHAMILNLRGCIERRYNLPIWKQADYEDHKIADQQAAANEARHIVGWSETEICALGIHLIPHEHDLLPGQAGLKPWEPWPPELAARLFHEQLDQLQLEMLETSSDAEIVAEMPSELNHDHNIDLTRPSQPTLVRVDGHGGAIEGKVVNGVRTEDGKWDLDDVFLVETTEGERFSVHGWNCITEVVQ